jgi:hypothetical protein
MSSKRSAVAIREPRRGRRSVAVSSARRARVSALDLVAADASACLDRSRLLNAPRTPAASRRRAERLRVRELVLGCLRDVENAARASRSVRATGSEA